MDMNFSLDKETLLALLTLPEWKEKVMTTFETLKLEGKETKDAVAAIGVSVAALMEKYNALAAKFADAVTPAEVAVAKADFDAAQADAQKLVDSINAFVNPPAA